MSIMQRIISNEDREKITKRNQLIMGAVLILIMIFSTMGFAFSFGVTGNLVEEFEYNGVEFVRDGNTGFWVFNVDGNEFYTIYNPEDVAEIKFVNNKKAASFSGKPVYFVGDPGDVFAEFYRAVSVYALRVGGACLDEDCEGDYPIKDCKVDNIVIIEEVLEVENVGLKEEIVTDNNCVYIRAKPENLIRYIDAYLFDLLGVG